MRRLLIGSLVGLLLMAVCMLFIMFVLPKVADENGRTMALRIEEAVKHDCGITNVKVDPSSFDELALWTTVYEAEGQNSIYIQYILPSTENQMWKCICK